MNIHSTLNLQASLHEKTSRLHRRHILESAIKIFAERGFHRATIRAIADRAGVSDGTIYNSFANKSDLLLAILDPLDELDASQNAPEPPADLPSFLRVLLQRQWESLTPQTLQVLKVVIAEVMTNEDLRKLYIDQVLTPLLTLPESHLSKLSKAGEINADDIRPLLGTIAATVMGLILLRLTGDDYTETNWENFPEFVADLLVGGIAGRRSERATHEDE